MAAEKTSGIVLRVVAFSETSCIVTLFTREFGKITTIAKGARRPKSPFEAAIDVLAICRLVFLDKSSGAMGILTEAKLERRFRGANRNLDQLYAGYYVVELLSSLNDEGDPQPDLFDFAVRTICEIDSPDLSNERLSQVLLRFELKTLELLGHLPMLTKCVGCGREKTMLTNVSFGLNLGGILCHTCRRGKSNVVTLSSNGLQFLLNQVGGQIGNDPVNLVEGNRTGNESEISLAFSHSELAAMHPNEVRENGNTRNWALGQPIEQNGGPAESNCVEELNFADGMVEVRHLMHKYISHLLGFQPKLHKYLKNI